MIVSSRHSEAGISVHAQETLRSSTQPASNSLRIQVPRLSYVSSSNGSHEDISQTARTDWTIDSRMAQSLRDAVVQTATPLARRSVRVRHLPPMPELKSQRTSPITMPQSLPSDMERAAVSSQQRRKDINTENLEVPKNTGDNVSAKKVYFSHKSIYAEQPTLSVQQKLASNGSSKHYSATILKPVVFYQSSTRSKSEGSLIHSPEEIQPFGEGLGRRVPKLPEVSLPGVTTRHEDTKAEMNIQSEFEDEPADSNISGPIVI